MDAANTLISVLSQAAKQSMDMFFAAIAALFVLPLGYWNEQYGQGLYFSEGAGPAIAKAATAAVLSFSWIYLVSLLGMWMWIPFACILILSILHLSKNDPPTATSMLAGPILFLVVVGFALARLGINAIWGEAVWREGGLIVVVGLKHALPFWWSLPGVVILLVLARLYKNRGFCEECHGSGKHFIGSKHRDAEDAAPYSDEIKYGWHHINYYKTCAECAGDGRKSGTLQGLAISLVLLVLLALTISTLGVEPRDVQPN